MHEYDRQIADRSDSGPCQLSVSFRRLGDCFVDAVLAYSLELHQISLPEYYTISPPRVEEFRTLPPDLYHGTLCSGVPVRRLETLADSSQRWRRSKLTWRRYSEGAARMLCRLLDWEICRTRNGVRSRIVWAAFRISSSVSSASLLANSFRLPVDNRRPR